MADGRRGPAEGQRGTEPVTGCFVKLGWMAGGSMMLLVFAITISQEPPWTFGVKDVAFWGVVVITVILRFVDVAHYGGRTADGQPATLRHVVRYSMGLVGVAALLWTLAQSVHFPV